MKKTIAFLVIACIGFSSCEKDIALDETGLPFFEQWYGESGDEFGRQLVALDDGFAACGYGNSAGLGGYDMLLLRMDEQGGKRFLNHYGTTGDEYCRSFTQTTDHGFVLAGWSNASGNDDLYLVKTDAAGATVWTQTYGGSQSDLAIHVRALDNGYLVSGITRSRGAGGEDVWILRLDNQGDTLWTTTAGGTGDDGGMYSCAGPNGTHTVVAYSNGSSTDGLVIRLNDQGQILGQYPFGTPAYDEPHAIAPAADGNGWIITGHYGSLNVPSHNVFLTALDSNGFVRWSRAYGGVEHDGSEDMVADGNRITIIARSNSRSGFGEDVYLVQTDYSGNVTDERWLGTDADDAGYGVVVMDDAYVVSGASRGGSGGGWDWYVRRVAR